MNPLYVTAVASWLLCGAPGPEEKARAPLPEGDAGIAARHPGDRGIEKHPDVVFVEAFEESSLDELKRRWESVSGAEILSLSSDAPPVSGGKRSLLMTHVGGKGTGAHLYRRLEPGHEKLNVRFYVKFDPDCAPIHHFFHVGGYNPPTPWPQGGAGERPRGDERFSTGVEPFGDAWRWDCYTYWMEMRGSPPRGQTWVNSFVRDPRVAVRRGEWTCAELMMELNDVGDSNGEMALWIDGKLVSHRGKGFPAGKWTFDKFIPGEGGESVRWSDEKGGPERFEVPAGGRPFEGFRWRRDARLDINFLWVLLYVTKAPPGHVSRVWFDHIVAAKEYIGPLAAAREAKEAKGAGDAGGARGAMGPLRVHPANPRYFAGPSGKAVYLTGSHTWNNLADMGRSDPPEAFDFDAYLDFLERHGHNFIRLWAWDSAVWDTRANGGLGKDFVHRVAPLPWARTGPGQALDGKPRFDLKRFDPEYFERLRARVSAARKRGIYVSVMLFEGWGLRHGNRGRAAPDGWAWRAHPFHRDNNASGIDGDADSDGLSGEVHTLKDPAVNAIQAAYIRKVVETVNDLDNVLYEVVNEGGEKEWDWWVVKTVRDHERTLPAQHPVGITGHGAERLESMLASPADWVSPGRVDGFGEDPPTWDGKKVSLLDTDHIWGVGGSPSWVWKSFLGGHNPIFMDPYDGAVLGTPSDRRWEPIRRALGQARRWAERMNLAAMTPRPDLASTRYCLADPGREYLVYSPEAKAIAVDLTAAAGELQVEWFDPARGESAMAGTARGGERRELKAPFGGEALLYLAVSSPGKASPPGPPRP
ncbi:MAG: hypothetical protein HY721_24600 [Planctomycetes bacterium]|nr:hypothetical protein [Planctomycetota bacterium]